MRHAVSAGMLVSRLVDEAADVFGVDPETIILLMLSMVPATLDRALSLEGPPRVGPNSTILVFVAVGRLAEHALHPARTSVRGLSAAIPGVPAMAALLTVGHIQVAQVRWHA